MKKSIEYKIHNFLNNRKNNDFLDVSKLEKNTNSLKNSILELKDRGFIETKAYPSRRKPNSINVILSEKPDKCKIKFDGREYLESLKIPKDRKIHLILFIIFSSSTLLFGYLNHQSNNLNDILDVKVDSLKHESLIYKDSVHILKMKIKLNRQQAKIDTLKTKNQN
jgi:hypothetical protein